MPKVETEKHTELECIHCENSPILQTYAIYTHPSGRTEPEFIEEECPNCGAEAKANERSISRMRKLPKL